MNRKTISIMIVALLLSALIYGYFQNARSQDQVPDSVQGENTLFLGSGDTFWFKSLRYGWMKFRIESVDPLEVSGDFNFELNHDYGFNHYVIQDVVEVPALGRVATTLVWLEVAGDGVIVRIPEADRLRSTSP